MSEYSHIEDSHFPIIPKPYLQQYDNYQIYDLYCEDTIYEDLVVENNIIPHPPHVKGQSFIAVQRYNPSKITCDFTEIAINYP